MANKVQNYIKYQLTSKNDQSLLPHLLKWRNFARSGHTAQNAPGLRWTIDKIIMSMCGTLNDGSVREIKCNDMK